MKKIFITGGCGYVGSLMIKNLLDKYNKEDFHLEGSNVESRIIYQANSLQVTNIYFNLNLEK